AIAASASQQPIKGILKNKSSVACSLVPSTMQQRNKSVDELSKKSMKWDEMNIVATYYIEDEDLIKVHEPSTPENSMESDDEGALGNSETIEVLNPEMLAKKLAAAKGSKPKYLAREQESSEDEDSDFSTEASEKQLEFEMKRKLHDNEGLNLKLARQLISKELLELEEDEEISKTAAGENMNMEESNQGSTTGGQLQNKSQRS
uniref:Protein phosphatase 1 regulatory inhibitor subunit 2 n=2 Tax=Myotis lucifugus TaxID=59463 RepID=G1QFK6_MYOLU